jgi:hypothetical protein
MLLRPLPPSSVCCHVRSGYYDAHLVYGQGKGPARHDQRKADKSTSKSDLCVCKRLTGLQFYFCVISILCSARLAACTRALSKSLIHVIHCTHACSLYRVLHPWCAWWLFCSQPCAAWRRPCHWQLLPTPR